MEDIINSPKEAREDDFKMGRRIREIRLVRGMSQEQLAEKIGVTFQQVQKYEKGANRISTSRIIDVAKALRVEVMDLFAPAFLPDGPAAAVTSHHVEALPVLEPITVEIMKVAMGMPQEMQRALRDVAYSMVSARNTAILSTPLKNVA